MIHVTAVMAEAGVSLKQGVGLTGADIGSMIGLQAPEGFGLAPSIRTSAWNLPF